jgi:hypothetical protein
MFDKKKKIREYFETPEPKFPTATFVIGIFLILIGTSNKDTTLFLLIGLVVLVASLFNYSNVKKRYEALPSDQQIDLWLEEELTRIMDTNALDKLGLDRDELVKSSLIIPGPIFWKVDGVPLKDILQKLGKDKFFRYSILNIEIFIFTAHYLANYGCVYNFLKNTTINEHTNEFFYKDVVSVRTDTQSSAYTLIGGEKLEHSQTFQLNLSGDQVSVVINDKKLKSNSKMTSRVDEAVQSIRAMLRDKKS